MLQIKSLTITHKKDLRTIVRDFNLVLNSGDKAVLIGEEGNGKSTLLKWIFDPALVENYVEADGIRTSQGELVGYLQDCRHSRWQPLQICISYRPK